MTTAIVTPVEEVKETQTGFRVFVGNLSYEVSADDLSHHFAACGNILTSTIIKRYGRSAGYGFVTFETQDAADKAINMKETEIKGRQINVESAVPRDDSAPKTRAKRGRGRGRGRGARTRRSLPEGVEPSKTTIFVGNLPFNVVDEDLYNIFDEYKVEKAHVVRRFNGASRGFGFVTFASTEEQAKALENMEEVWCDERKLVIRAALSDEARKPAQPDEPSKPE